MSAFENLQFGERGNGQPSADTWTPGERLRVTEGYAQGRCGAFVERVDSLEVNGLELGPLVALRLDGEALPTCFPVTAVERAGEATTVAAALADLEEQWQHSYGLYQAGAKLHGFDRVGQALATLRQVFDRQKEPAPRRREAPTKEGV